MADFKYLKENNLYESHKRFMRALGEGYGYAPLEEADDDQNQPDDGAMPQGGDPGAMPPQGGDPGAMPPQGGDPSMGGDPGAMPQGGDMGGDPGSMPPPQGGDPSMGGDAGAMPTPQNGEVPDIDEAGGEEDEVISVEDLTDAQEKMNDKVNSVGKDLGKVDTRIEKLIGAIDKLGAMFDKNNQEIDDFRREFEKRNPTQTERLNLRSLDSYPFNVRPTDYWRDKAEQGGYQAYSDNSEPTTMEYKITNSDVDDFSEREIADSFFVDDELNQDIKKIFGLA